MSNEYTVSSEDRRYQAEERRAWLLLSQVPGLKLPALWQGIAVYHSAQAVLERLREGLITANRHKTSIPANSLTEALEERALRRKERILTPADSEYPRQLLDLPQPPAALFVAGAQNIQARNQLAVVGSRLATPYGMSQAASLARHLAEKGVIVTSGLARGIDSQAHRGALKGGGRTIAVIGCGLDVCYPRENARLQQRLASEGNVISEYAYGMPPNAWNFPARNRLIAALALGTVIVQASRHSGALITAHIANELGREVMVVPGAIDVKQSGGCLQLLMEGANPVRHVRDVFDVLKVFEDQDQSSPILRQPQSQTARQILETLTVQGDTIDGLVEKCRLAPGVIAAVLHQLGLTGYVQPLPEGVWIPTA